MAAGFQLSRDTAELERQLHGIEAALRAGDMARAIRLAGEAAEKGFAHPNILTLAVYDCINRGDDSQALAFAERARSLSPRNPDVLNAAGICYSRLGRHREALAAFDLALGRQPGASHIRFRKACAHEDLSELSRARIEFERVLAAEPANAEVLARLSHLAAQRGDVTSARDFGNRALRLDPGQAGAVLSLAMADIEEGKYADAAARVQPLTAPSNRSPVNRSIALGLLGDSFDGMERYKEAFAAYAASKSVLRAYYRPVYEADGTETARARADRLIAYFKTADGSWQAKKDKVHNSSVGTHVFLVGFPRSGTTLLEAVLDGHPDIESMEERDCLTDALKNFIVPRDGLDRLAHADDRTLDEFRDAYWKRAAEFGIHPERKVFVDKLPLNSVLLCLVAKLFPRAKILFALRDPRDVVLSCFRRRFGMTAQMYEFTALDSAARYYDAVLSLWALYRETLALDICELRYENLVSDFDGTVAGVCGFLGVHRHENMAAFAERAARNIDTPSNVQLARGLFRHGVGQWRHYADALAPVMPLLAPWIARFGYGKD